MVTLLAETCLVIELRPVLLRPSSLSMIVDCILMYVEYNQLLVLKLYHVRIFLKIGGTTSGRYNTTELFRPILLKPFKLNVVGSNL